MSINVGDIFDISQALDGESPGAQRRSFREKFAPNAFQFAARELGVKFGPISFEERIDKSRKRPRVTIRASAAVTGRAVGKPLKSKLVR